MKITKSVAHAIATTDIAAQRWVNAHQDKTLRKVFAIITCLGSGYLWLFFYSIMFILGPEGLRTIVIAMIWAELLGLLIIIVVRNFIKRERPIPHPDFLLPLPWQAGSFPSHHALRAAILATFLGTYYPAWAPLICFYALAVSFSRIYLNMHYFWDVCGGLIAGFICAQAGLLIILNHQP